MQGKFSGVRTGLCLWLTGCSLLFSSMSHASGNTLVIGKVSDNPKKHYRYLKPIVDYVVERMQDLGVTEGKVLMASNNRQMIRYLKQGKVDWVTETPFSAVLFHEKANAEYLLRKWKKGHAEYHSVIFARKDSGINSLNDLQGKKIAFEDPGSSSAYFIPAAILLNHGLKLTRLTSPRQAPPQDYVGYVFSREEINTSTWVYRRLVQAGAYNNLDWEKDDHLPNLYRQDMKIIHRSKPFPRAIELVSNKMEQRVKARLKQILLQMHNDPGAQQILYAYQKTNKFDEISPQVMDGLQEVKRLLDIVKTELK